MRFGDRHALGDHAAIQALQLDIRHGLEALRKGVDRREEAFLISLVDRPFPEILE